MNLLQNLINTVKVGAGAQPVVDMSVQSTRNGERPPAMVNKAWATNQVPYGTPTPTWYKPGMAPRPYSFPGIAGGARKAAQPINQTLLNQLQVLPQMRMLSPGGLPQLAQQNFQRPQQLQVTPLNAIQGRKIYEDESPLQGSFYNQMGRY